MIFKSASQDGVFSVGVCGNEPGRRNLRIGFIPEELTQRVGFNDIGIIIIIDTFKTTKLFESV